MLMLDELPPVALYYIVLDVQKALHIGEIGGCLALGH